MRLKEGKEKKEIKQETDTGSAPNERATINGSLEEEGTEGNKEKGNLKKKLDYSTEGGNGENCQHPKKR